MDTHVRYVEMLSLLGRIAGKSLAEAITEEYETERSLEGLKVALESFLPKITVKRIKMSRKTANLNF